MTSKTRRDPDFGPELLPSGFAYAGEGPEIGRDYGYRISGFVTHSPTPLKERLRSILRTALAVLAAVRPTLRLTRQPATLAASSIGNRVRPLPAPVLVMARRTARSMAGLVSIVARHLVLPLARHVIFLCVRYPATTLALTLAATLAVVLTQGTRQASEPLFSDEPFDLRLGTAGITTLTTPDATGDTSQLRDPWRAARGRALPIFALDAAELGGLQPSYAIRMRAEAREDSLAWSEPQGRADVWPPLAPLVLIVAQRRLAEAEPSSLYLDTTRRAALYGLSVMRSAVSSDVKTKFGTIEVADVILAANAATPAEEGRACLAFRHARQPEILRLTGWLCAPKDRVVERPTLAALIDRLSLVGAGNDERLHQIFVDADLAKAEAAASRIPRKALPWLDQPGEKPQLKGERAPKKRG